MSLSALLEVPLLVCRSIAYPMPLTVPLYATCTNFDVRGDPVLPSDLALHHPSDKRIFLHTSVEIIRPTHGYELR